MKIKPKTKPDTSHARLAPSAFKGYEVCPSYKPSHEATKASERGTELHGKLEEHEERAHEHVEDADDAVQMEVITTYIAPFLAFAKKRHLKILKEYTFNLKPAKIDGCEKGTGDLLIVDAHDADLFDYKMGWWEVDDTEVNIQIWIYVLGVFFAFPGVQRVKAHVLQPARDELGTHVFTRADVTRMWLRARTIADRVNANAGRVFNPIADTCLWCDNKANCIALHAMALKAAHQANLNVPDGVPLDPEDFDDLEAAGDVYDFADIISKWASSIKWKITQMALDGEDVPGHDLRETAGKRIIVDPEGAFEVLRDKYEVSLSEFLAESKPSITGLLKAVSAHAIQGQKGNKQLAASGDLMSAGVVTKTSPSAFLVRVKTKEPKTKG